MLGADAAQRGEVAGRGKDDAGLPLDGLDDDGDRVGTDSRLHGRGVPEGNVDEARDVGAVIRPGIGVRGHGDRRQGAAVEISVRADDLLGTVGNPLDLGAPAASGLQCGFDRFRPRVHGKGGFIACESAELFQEGAHPVVVEGPGTQGDPAELSDRRRHDARVEVPLVHRRIGR